MSVDPQPKRVKKETTTTTTSSSNNNNNGPIIDDLDSIRFGAYEDLLKDYAKLSMCTVNTTPSQPPPSQSTSSSSSSSSPSTKQKQKQRHQSKDKDKENTNEVKYVDSSDDDPDKDVSTTTSSTSGKRKKHNKPLTSDDLETLVPYDKSVAASQRRLQEHIQQCRSNPTQHEIFQSMNDVLIAPTYVDAMCPNEKLSQQEIIERLKKRQGIYLHELDSSHADLLNHESGSFPVSDDPKDRYRIRDFVPCMRGVNCFVNRGQIPLDPYQPHAKPFIARELMFPHEYQHFIRTGTKCYEGVRPCVICCRYSLTLSVPRIRACRSQASRGNNNADQVNWPVLHDEKEPEDQSTPLQMFREKMDTEGGYLGSYMLKPIPGVWEGFIDPIALVSLTRLVIRAKQTSAGTWICYLDQSLMKYQPDIPEQPFTGESIPNLYYIARQLRQHHQQHHEAQLSDLLRSSSQHSKNSYYDMLAIDAQLMNPGSGSSTTTSGTGRSSSYSVLKANQNEFEKDEQGFARVICEDTLEPMYDVIHSVALFDHISTVNDPIIHIISKVVKSKCRIRKSDDVWNRKFTIPENLAKKCALAQKESVKKMYKRMIAQRTGIRPKLHQWVLCSLLGNYRHTQDSKRLLDPSKRKLCYELFANDKFHEFTNLLRKRCSNLFNFAIREYLVFCVEDMPAFHSQLIGLFDWNDFRTKVIKAMDEYRTWFASQSIVQTVNNGKNPVIYPPVDFFEFTSQHFQDAHESLEHYYASVFTVSCILKKKRLRVPLVPLPDEIKQELTPKVDIDQELEQQLLEVMDSVDDFNDEEEEDEDFSDDDEMDLTAGITAYKPKELRAIDAREKERESASERKMRGITLTDYMPPSHIQVLTTMVKKHIDLHYRDLLPVPYVPTSTLFFVMKYMRLFGFSKPTVVRLVRLMTLIQKGKLSDHGKTFLLRNFRATEPYAYTVIQCCVDVIERQLETVVVAELPVHYWQNQIKAIQNRYPWTQQLNCVPMHSTFLYFCRHCKSVCVILSRFDTTHEHKAAYTKDTNNSSQQQQQQQKKKQKRAELAVVSSYSRMYGDITNNDTDTKWCRKNRGTRFKECAIDPLCCPSLLGRMIKIKRELICLCTKCAFPMVYNPTRCAVLSTGVVCSRCTTQHENSKYITKYHLMIELGYPPGQETANCMICNKVLKKTSSIYLYPFHVLLCGTCSSDSISRSVDLAINGIGNKKKVNNKQELIAFIIELIRIRNERREHYKCSRLARYGRMTRNKWMSQNSSDLGTAD